MDLARAAPPFRPSAAAAGSLHCSSGVGSRSPTYPVATSITSLAAWEKSRGRLRGLSVIRRPDPENTRRIRWLSRQWFPAQTRRIRCPLGRYSPEKLQRTKYRPCVPWALVSALGRELP